MSKEVKHTVVPIEEIYATKPVIPTKQENTRAWIFDALMECGQKLAEVNHLEEKINGLKSLIRDEENLEKSYEMTDKLANMRLLVDKLSEDRRKLMDFIMSSVDSSDEERCLLKHALLDYTIACELYEANVSEPFFEDNMETTANTLAGVISLTLGLEFKTCLRCLADKYTKK